MNKSILNSQGFGVSNGTTTIIALLAGFVAAGIPKVAVISTLLSLLLTDPLSDAYSIYIAMKDTNEKEAYEKFKGTFISQLIIQSLFLLIVVMSPSIYMAFIISSLIGLCLVIYDFNKRLKEPKLVLIELIKIIGLIVLTFVVNKKLL